MNKLLSVKEAAELLGLRVPTIYKYVCQRAIPYVKIGTRVLFDPARLEAWVKRHERQATAKAIV